MPKRCLVGGCSNVPRAGSSLHKLYNPRYNAVKTTRTDWNGPSEWSLLCSSHFKDDDFDQMHIIKRSLGIATSACRLLPTAVPSVFARPRLNIAMPEPEAESIHRTGVRGGFRKPEHQRVCHERHILNKLLKQIFFFANTAVY